MPIEKAIENAQVIRFATFHVDLTSGELRNGGVKLKLSGGFPSTRHSARAAWQSRHPRATAATSLARHLC